MGKIAGVSSKRGDRVESVSNIRRRSVFSRLGAKKEKNEKCLSKRTGFLESKSSDRLYLTNRQNFSGDTYKNIDDKKAPRTSKFKSNRKKLSPAVDADWENWDEDKLDNDDERMLEKKKQLLERELAKQLDTDKLNVAHKHELDGSAYLDNKKSHGTISSIERCNLMSVHTISESSDASGDSSVSSSESKSSTNGSNLAGIHRVSSRSTSSRDEGERYIKDESYHRSRRDKYEINKEENHSKISNRRKSPSLSDFRNKKRDRKNVGERETSVVTLDPKTDSNVKLNVSKRDKFGFYCIAEDHSVKHHSSSPGHKRKIGSGSHDSLHSTSRGNGTERKRDQDSVRHDVSCARRERDYRRIIIPRANEISSQRNLLTSNRRETSPKRLKFRSRNMISPKSPIHSKDSSFDARPRSRSDRDRLTQSKTRTDNRRPFVSDRVRDQRRVLPRNLSRPQLNRRVRDHGGISRLSRSFEASSRTVMHRGGIGRDLDMRQSVVKLSETHHSNNHQYVKSVRSERHKANMSKSVTTSVNLYQNRMEGNQVHKTELLVSRSRGFNQRRTTNVDNIKRSEALNSSQREGFVNRQNLSRRRPRVDLATDKSKQTSVRRRREGFSPRLKNRKTNLSKSSSRKTVDVKKSDFGGGSIESVSTADEEEMDIKLKRSLKKSTTPASHLCVASVIEDFSPETKNTDDEVRRRGVVFKRKRRIMNQRSSTLINTSVDKSCRRDSGRTVKLKEVQSRNLEEGETMENSRSNSHSSISADSLPPTKESFVTSDSDGSSGGCVVLEGISDEDLEDLSNDEDDNHVQNDESNAKLADALGADWSILLPSADHTPTLGADAEVRKKQWCATAILNRVGICRDYLSNSNYEEIIESINKNSKKESKDPEFHPFDACGGLHVLTYERAERRKHLLKSNTDSRFNFSLSAKKDLDIRRELCNLRPINEFDEGLLPCWKQTMSMGISNRSVSIVQKL